MSNTQYHSLNDASEHPEVRPSTQSLLRRSRFSADARIEVWYAINPTFMDNGVFSPFDDKMGPTHVLLGEVDYQENWQSLYGALQGEFWSPNGEANSLIQSKGLRHTSMSVGDVLVVYHPRRSSETWMCASTGWRQL